MNFHFRLRQAFRPSLAILTLLLGLFTLAACSNDDRLTIITASASHVFSVEIADDAKERAEGLMFRQQMADDHGMLFDFGEERPVSFWMKNTFIPLDMIFIRADGTISNIHSNARPHDETGIPSDGPVKYVLEINGGLATKLGIASGDRVAYSGIGEN